MLRKTNLFFLFIFAVSGIFNMAAAQPSWTIDLLGKQKKPEKFENRKLGSEKLAEKNFTPVRHFFQNNFTHYNYFYNANNKIESVIERAKIAQVDDFSKLISFYPYSLNNTATQSTELDSVILKSVAGILLHDLRNDWIDNMYLLMGKAYFLKKEFDSAAYTFQFINYNLFPRKRKNDDEDKIIGTNYGSSNNIISIANKEKRNIIQKATSRPPSRNDALLWLARTLIEQEEFNESAGLIKTLQNDPNLPKRLKNDLDELTSYLFYRQNNYDSSAAYLSKALSNADTKQDRSRSEFLLGQMYELTKQYSKASQYYRKAASHTTNPIQDIYANLSEAKMLKDNDPKELNNSIENLKKMAKKDKYEAYRDIIYYAAGELEMQKADTSNALAFYNKSLSLNESNVIYKNKAFLRIADIAFTRKQFKVSFANYDSLQTGDTSLVSKAEDIQKRRNALSDIVEKINIIEREDSLQRIAALPLADRDAFLKKLSKKLRKELGLKEEDNNSGMVIDAFNTKNVSVDLFSDNSAKGEWYFYNSSLKSKGLNEFKVKWGTRSNVDNWRRKAAIETQFNNSDMALSNPDGLSPDDQAPVTADKSTEKSSTQQDVSYDGLMANLPLTEEKLTESNRILSSNLFKLAQLYQNRLEDYEMAIDTYDECLKRYPDSLHDGELYLGMYYCYNKTGNPAKALYYKNLLTSKFKDSYSSKLLTNPKEAKPLAKNTDATKRYENVYALFIEGKFSDAITEKQKADSTYGKNYWTPQLLFIESVYYIKQKEDSTAKNILTDITKLYPSTPLAAKAANIIDVLGRRAEIEKYLKELVVTRDDENTRKAIAEMNALKKQSEIAQAKIDSARNASANPVSAKNETAVKEDVKKEEIKAPSIGPFINDPALAHNVVMILNKVDPTYINETKNALGGFNNDKFRSQGITITKEALDGENTLLIFSTFSDFSVALQYLEKLKRAAPSEISWLPASKYSFIICNDDNLYKLKEGKNLSGYKTFLNSLYPGKF